MSEQNPEELVIAGTGDLYVATVGATLPDDPIADLDAAFTRLGLTDEDGTTMTYTPTVTDFNAWQSPTPVRRVLTAADFQIAANLEQWNRVNVSLAFGGGEVREDPPGTFRYTFPDGSSPIAINALVADFADGAKHYRVVVPRGNVTEAVATRLTRSALGLLPLSFRALGGSGPIAYMLTDDPSWGEGS